LDLGTKPYVIRSCSCAKICNSKAQRDFDLIQEEIDFKKIISLAFLMGGLNFISAQSLLKEVFIPTTFTPDSRLRYWIASCYTPESVTLRQQLQVLLQNPFKNHENKYFRNLIRNPPTLFLSMIKLLRNNKDRQNFWL